ncbi:replication-relaxation family protein [Micromonospora sp. WMMD1082]|uniref:replication-relaxation family protein n=1 Tax=Micromonospora sp. WMMD1082 TaxID=3016104 RepID=UPI002416DB99|nr:replication-relaxation family protein [Micromonospora sp. WMMD1082]MDG4795058.1 replication-relaxation family protein [Micromonospora sp. WMMD1082]
MSRRPLPPRTAKSDPFHFTRYLTRRDRRLLSWLAEHYLLSTGQVTKALFPSGRSARLRLTRLHRLEVLDRFVDDESAESSQYLYALGPKGFTINRDAYHDPDNPTATPARSSRERGNRIVGSRKLQHLLGVNDFFCDLLAHARTNPQARLRRWWSEQHATDAYGAAGVQPDGHGVWTVGDTTVGFFLEHDRNTEPLGTVLRKLRGYERVTEFGPTYPLLLWVPGRGRERHLLDALAGVDTAMPVATGVHGTDPAGPVWTLASDPGRPRHLHELPSDHGPYTATNSSRFIQPDDA